MSASSELRGEDSLIANLPSLTADRLCQHSDPSRFTFETTADLEELSGTLGQDRAVEAIRFGIGIHQKGFNLFVLGPAGTGKHTFVREFVARQAASEPTPPDWCYVNNFGQAQELIDRLSNCRP